MRLVGGGGDGRSIYLPFGLNAAPPFVFLPAWPQSDVALMMALDPDQPETEPVLCYQDSGTSDRQGYRLYNYSEDYDEIG